MKRINLVQLLFSVCFISLLTESCNDESGPQDLCVIQGVECENGSTCEEGICDCLFGFIGNNCETMDTTYPVQTFLSEGVSPKILFDNGIPLDSLYGKIYLDGMIFYMNTEEGNGLVAADIYQDTKAEWGCISTNVSAMGLTIGQGEQNTNAILNRCTVSGIAAELCREQGSGWFLPSKDELNLVYENLFSKDHGGLGDGTYWSSSEVDANFAWFQSFRWGEQGTANKTVKAHVLPVRSF